MLVGKSIIIDSHFTLPAASPNPERLAEMLVALGDDKSRLTEVAAVSLRREKPDSAQLLRTGRLEADRF